MKKTIAVILVVIVLLSFGACNSATPKSDQNTQILSTYDQLNENEKLIFDALIIATKNFNDPSKVRLLDFGYIVDYVVEGECDLHYIIVKLQTTILAGGVKAENYMLYLKRSSFPTGKIKYKGDIEGTDMTPSTPEPGVDRAKINKALIEYWENEGLL